MVESTPLTRERSEPLSLADLGKKIKSDHEALANSIASIVPRAISIGEDLNKAKALVGHGSFLKWVKLNCAMSNKNAERYMKLATPARTSSSVSFKSAAIRRPTNSTCCRI